MKLVALPFNTTSIARTEDGYLLFEVDDALIVDVKQRRVMPGIVDYMLAGTLKAAQELARGGPTRQEKEERESRIKWDNWRKEKD